MEKDFDGKTPIRAAIREMSVGDTIHFPIARLSVVRVTAWTLGLELERKYTARANKDAMTIDVVRNC